MTHRGPFQPLPFCDSVTLENEIEGGKTPKHLFKAYGEKSSTYIPYIIVLI